AVNLFSAFYHPGLVVVGNKTMKLEAIVNHETSSIHTTCIVVSRAQTQPLHKAQAFKQLTDMSCCTLLCCTVLNSFLFGSRLLSSVTLYACSCLLLRFLQLSVAPLKRQQQAWEMYYVPLGSCRRKF